MKQIIKNIAFLLIISIAVSGCSFAKKRILNISTKPTERIPLNLSEDYPLDLDQIEWIIVTEENVQQVFADLKKKGYEPVLWALTDKDYEIASVNEVKKLELSEYRRQIIITYKKYYEPQKEQTPKTDK